MSILLIHLVLDAVTVCINLPGQAFPVWAAGHHRVEPVELLLNVIILWGEDLHEGAMAEGSESKVPRPPALVHEEQISLAWLDTSA